MLVVRIAEPHRTVHRTFLLRIADITSDDQIESFFDPVVYEKGAALLRLLRAFLDRDAEPPVCSWNP